MSNTTTEAATTATEAATGHATEAGAAAGHAAESAGMPQLDFSTFGNQIFWLLVAELHRFGGTTGRVVLRVKIQDDDLASESLGGEFHATCGVGLKIRQGFVQSRRHAAACYLGAPADASLGL